MLGTDPVTGRNKIANDVLEEMRRYLMAETGDSHAIKVDRIHQSLKEVSRDTMMQRATLRLEAPPVIISDLNRGKGLVFDYSDNFGSSRALSTHSNPEKLLADSFKAHSSASACSAPHKLRLLEEEASAESFNAGGVDYSTVFRAGSSAPCSSGIVKKRPAVRRRPPKAVRDQRKREELSKAGLTEESKREGKQIAGSKKRKCSEEKAEEDSPSTKAVPEGSFKSFADMLSSCNMEELPSKGDRFTWGGMRWKKWIQCCLDRGFGNTAWHDTFPGSNQTFLAKRGSDHRPVWVNLRANPEMQRGQFRFDKRLLHHPDAKREVEGAWKSLNSNSSVAVRIRKCRGIMSAWKRKRRFNAKDKINKLQERLEWFQSKSYPCWNSKFFHLAVKANRNRMYLLKLKDKRGQDQWSDAAKAEVAIEYFTELFTTSNPASYEAAFQSMVPKVTLSMNKILTASLGTRPSFAWRSIIFGRELLQKGLKRQIGNGLNTRAWIDKWLLDPELGMRAPWIKNENRAWPWIIWFLWKSRNDFIFNGVRWTPKEILEKAKKEADEWFLAQEVDKEVALEVKGKEMKLKKRWMPPREGWLMCNIGFEWNKDLKLLGGAWVVRNHRGVVLSHSRRAFSEVESLAEARLETLLWALESMTSLRYDRMVFAGDFKELFLAFKKPGQWPAFTFQRDEMSVFLSRMNEFQLKQVSMEENRGAVFIAQSVTRQNRRQSYVAQGHPSWLFEFFVNESRFL
ncbi:hypothetical protein Bca52824_010096 [Brassica carinata]|uniref:RNase H type-1 domain-containing protein n=1 Tax=Brassica carinata TaxID=52824 RepID=A0A8X8BAJ1_BRACI|nr:hypothetical protein Bca52824_010096 [Brassica carinata]